MYAELPELSSCFSLAHLTFNLNHLSFNRFFLSEARESKWVQVPSAKATEWVQCSPVKSSRQMFIFGLFCWVTMPSTSVCTPPSALQWVPIILILKAFCSTTANGKKKMVLCLLVVALAVSTLFFFVFITLFSVLFWLWGGSIYTRSLNLQFHSKKSLSFGDGPVKQALSHCLLEVIGISVSWGYSGEVGRCVYDKGKDWEGDIDQDFPHS